MKSKTFIVISIFLIIFITASIIYATEFSARSQNGKPVLIGKTAPDFDLPGVSGTYRSPLDFRGKFVVLEWVDFDCQQVKEDYSGGSVQKLQVSFKEKGVIWLSICSSKSVKKYTSKVELLKCLAEAKSKATDFLSDRSGNAAKTYNVDVTPYVFIINPEGRIIYAGAMGNTSGVTNYLEQTLEEAMSGKMLSRDFNQPNGCIITN